MRAVLDTRFWLATHVITITLGYMATFVSGIIGIFYGALLSFAQTDIKRLVAYSSVSHMGFIVLGAATLSVMGLNGAIFNMFSHGLIVGILFFTTAIVGKQAFSRRIHELGGLVTKMPFVGWVLVFGSLASLGLPGLSGFVAELTILIGTYGSLGNIAFIAMVSLAITAAYYIWMLQRAVFGSVNPRIEEARSSLTWAETVPLIVLVILVTYLGVYPAGVMDMVSLTSKAIVAMTGGA